MMIFGLVLSFVFTFLILKFFNYHLELVSKNITTIEQLDEQRGNTAEFNYDMGTEWNWNFVFGRSKFLWFVPIDQGIAGPVGDGTIFMKQ